MLDVACFPSHSLRAVAWTSDICATGRLCKLVISDIIYSFVASVIREFLSRRRSHSSSNLVPPLNHKPSSWGRATHMQSVAPTTSLQSHHFFHHDWRQCFLGRVFFPSRHLLT